MRFLACLYAEWLHKRTRRHHIAVSIKLPPCHPHAAELPQHAFASELPRHAMRVAMEGPEICRCSGQGMWTAALHRHPILNRHSRTPKASMSAVPEALVSCWDGRRRRQSMEFETALGQVLSEAMGVLYPRVPILVGPGTAVHPAGRNFHSNEHMKLFCMYDKRGSVWTTLLLTKSIPVHTGSRVLRSCCTDSSSGCSFNFGSISHIRDMTGKRGVVYAYNSIFTQISLLMGFNLTLSISLCENHIGNMCFQVSAWHFAANFLCTCLWPFCGLFSHPSLG